MKAIFTRLILMSIFFSVDVNATGCYQSMQKHVVKLGEAIETTDNVPLIGKLTNVLPFAITATCLRRCPGQTMVGCAGLLLYILAHNDTVRSLVNKYNLFATLPN